MTLMPRLASSGEKPQRRLPPAATPEQRNNQLIAMSYDAAEKAIREGKATSQLLTHFLKQGTAREELERARLEHENELLKARTSSMASAEETRELYLEVMAAMTEYSGDDPHD
jgi:hypothetical protein